MSPLVPALHKASPADHDQLGVARQLLPRRNSGELAHDEFEVALNRSQVGASLAALRPVSPFGTCVSRSDAVAGEAWSAWRKVSGYSSGMAM
jgi:hypothetical protein